MSGSGDSGRRGDARRRRRSADPEKKGFAEMILCKEMMLGELG